MTVAEVATRLGVSAGHVHKLVERGALTPAQRYPRLLLFAPADVERYASERRPRGRPRKRREGDDG